MPLPPPLVIDPPLLNTANPWATDLADLMKLYHCPHTGAVTTRTSLLAGFPHDPAIHQFVFFEAAAHDPAAVVAVKPSASLNTLGYSPLTLDQYLYMIQQVVAAPPPTATNDVPNRKKGFLVSVTGTPDDVAACYQRIVVAQRSIQPSVPLAMEINLSCPNIPHAARPAYDSAALLAYLTAVQDAVVLTEEAVIPVGLKTPPYTHVSQFNVLIDALSAAATTPSAGGVCPISFLTATNTLGSSLVLTTDVAPAIHSAGHIDGLGGMAGAPLHPLALGNVATLRRLLDSQPDVLGHVQIIGAGGVANAAGFARMKSVGAYAVGVGTALGIHGIDVFGEILEP